MTVDSDNRLATFNGTNVTNDLNGNMTGAPLTNGTFATYTYDARNRLGSAGGLSYMYDAAGNRLALTNAGNVTQFVINPNAKLPQIMMRIRSEVTNFYVYGNGLLYEVTETATTTNTATYHYDSRGSTVALTDTNGNVTDHVEYSAYGMTTYRLGTNDTPFLYNGRYGVQTDANGLLYMRARYYNPYLCRFVNADPSGFSGGLNWYAYADGNPISELDPFGLGAVTDNDMFSWINVNSVPNIVGLLAPNVFPPPLAFQAPGDDPYAPGDPSFDPSLPTTAQIRFGFPGTPPDPETVQLVNGIMAMAAMATTSLLDVPELFAAEGDMVTVTHFTDAQTVVNIQNGTRTLNAGTFVTLPSEVAGMNASQVETALEIDAGKGAYSSTFQTPAENLGPAFNGSLTSGGKIQFQLINPTPPGPFVPTPH